MFPSHSELQKRARQALPVIALFFITLVFFSDILKERALFTERDLGIYFIPPRFFWVESLRHGAFPLWNPLNFGGHPFFATLQPAVLYPPNWLFFILPFNTAYNWIIIGHFFLAGAFTFVLLRYLGASRWASFFGAASFMLGGYLLSAQNLLSVLLSVVWAPLIILFFLRALRGNSLWRAVWAGIFLAISFLGGGIEVALSTVMILVLMVIFSRSLGGVDLRLAIKAITVTGLVFLGLTAVQMLPFLELAGNSIRKNGLNFGEAMLWSAAPSDFLSFFIPDPYGSLMEMDKYWLRQSWLKTLYVGALPFLFAAFYLSKKERGKGFWLTLAAVSLFLALGRYNPLYFYFFKYVPVMNKIRYPVKFLFPAIMALSVMAGLGFHRLLESVRQGGGMRFGRVVLVTAFIAACLLLALNLAHTEVLGFLKAGGFDTPVYNNAAVNLHNAKRMLFYFVLGSAVLWFVIKNKGSRYAVGVVCLVLIFDLFGNWGYYARTDPRAYWSDNWTVQHIKAGLGNQRVLVTPLTLNSTFIAPNVNPQASSQRVLYPALNLNYAIRDMWGVEVMRVKRTDDLFKKLTTAKSIDASRIVDLFSVKYVITTKPISSAYFDLDGADIAGLEGSRQELLSKPSIKIYRNKRVLPRTFLVRDYTVEPDPEAVLTRISQRNFSPDHTVIFEEKPVWDPRIPAGQASVKAPVAEIMSEGNNRVEISARVKEPALLFLADTFYPGWNAYVDGKKTKIYRADYNFRAVPLPPGEHRVDFRYEPLSFYLGAWISGVTLLILMALGLRPFWLRQRKRRQIAIDQMPTAV